MRYAFWRREVFFSSLLSDVAMSDLRRRILDASVALVAERGVRAMSFREVARRAGVSHQAPYHHFGSDQGILHEVAREGFSALSEAMRAAAQSAGADPLEALTRAGVAYVGFAREHLGHFRVMFQRSLVDVHDQAAPLAEAEQTHGVLVALCDEVKRGGFAKGLSSEALTTMTWSLVHGLATLLVEGTLEAKTKSGDEAALIKKTVRAMAGLLKHE